MGKLSNNPEIKNKIKKEFYQCMLEMPYNKITVKMLVGRLGMSRQNLYRYYISKDEILLDMLDNTLDIAYQVIELNLDEFENNVENLAIHLEGMFSNKKELVNEVLFSSNEKLVFAHLRTFMRRVVGRVLRDGGYTQIDHDYLDIVISQYTGSGFYLLKEWGQSHGELSRDKLRRSIVVFLEGLFQAIKENARIQGAPASDKQRVPH